MSEEDYSVVLDGVTYVTIEGFAKLVGAKVSAIRSAFSAVGVQGRRDISDGRRWIYPSSEVGRVRQWIVDSRA